MSQSQKKYFFKARLSVFFVFFERKWNIPWVLRWVSHKTKHLETDMFQFSPNYQSIYWELWKSVFVSGLSFNKTLYKILNKCPRQLPGLFTDLFCLKINKTSRFSYFRNWLQWRLLILFKKSPRNIYSTWLLIKPQNVVLHFCLRKD